MNVRDELRAEFAAISTEPVRQAWQTAWGILEAKHDTVDGIARGTRVAATDAGSANKALHIAQRARLIGFEVVRFLVKKSGTEPSGHWFTESEDCH